MGTRKGLKGYCNQLAIDCRNFVVFSSPFHSYFILLDLLTGRSSHNDIGQLGGFLESQTVKTTELPRPGLRPKPVPKACCFASEM